MYPLQLPSSSPGASCKIPLALQPVVIEVPHPLSCRWDPSVARGMASPSYSASSALLLQIAFRPHLQCWARELVPLGVSSRVLLLPDDVPPPLFLPPPDRGGLWVLWLTVDPLPWADPRSLLVSSLLRGASSLFSDLRCPSVGALVCHTLFSGFRNLCASKNPCLCLLLKASASSFFPCYLV